MAAVGSSAQHGGISGKGVQLCAGRSALQDDAEEGARGARRPDLSDLAIAPPKADEFKALDIYHATTGGEAALKHKKRDDDIRARTHVLEEIPLLDEIPVEAAE